MSLDRYGNAIRIGFSETEIIYIKSAMSLPRAERWAAFEDIASMSCRTVQNVRAKAYALHNQALAEYAARRLGEWSVRRSHSKPVLAPSIIEPVSEARKMAGRAYP